MTAGKFPLHCSSMRLSLEFLGTGTSVGVPMIGCDCAVCKSTDPRDKRLRSSAIVRAHNANDKPETTVLLDTTPDLRYQMLRGNVRHLDAIIITHFHADHVMGIDDIRRFNIIQKQVLEIWGTAATLASMRKSFGYVFSDTLRYGWPSLVAREIKIGETFNIGSLNFLSLRARSPSHHQHRPENLTRQSRKWPRHLLLPGRQTHRRDCLQSAGRHRHLNPRHAPRKRPSHAHELY